MSNVEYTVVFFGHPANINGNPFDVETPFGTVRALGVSNSMEDADRFREALKDIAAGDPDAAGIAKAAIDERDAALTANLKAGRR
jgi:hypothetical protein